MYGEGRNLRYFIGFGVVIILLIFLIVLIVHHGNSRKVPVTQKPLTSYTDDSSVTVSETIVGPISAAQTHDQIEIDVSNQTATINISKGYDNNIVTNKTYAQTTAGFGEFLSALQRANFTKGNTASDLKDDRGYCPTGNRYIYEVKEGGDTIERFWATSCGGTKTYQGNLGLTISLFESQIPDYDNLTQNTSFGPSLIDL